MESELKRCCVRVLSAACMYFVWGGCRSTVPMIRVLLCSTLLCNIVDSSLWAAAISMFVLVLSVSPSAFCGSACHVESSSCCM